jgi:hypothetical protein
LVKDVSFTIFFISPIWRIKNIYRNINAHD